MNASHTSPSLEHPAPVEIPVTLELQIMAERATPVRDTRNKLTGWKMLTDSDHGIAVIVTDAADRAFKFQNPDNRSGTGWVLTQIVAGCFAVDNPVQELAAA